jgi:hypothetical protein
MNLLLAALAINLAFRLEESGSDAPAYLLPSFLLVFLFIVAVYLRQPRKPAVRSYGLRKMLDGLLLAVGFVLMVLYTMQLNSRTTWVESAAASQLALSAKTTETLDRISNMAPRAERSRKDKRFLRKELRHQLKRYAASKLSGRQQDGLEALLIIATIVGAAGLLLLISALACSISCGGADGLAVVVWIVGLAAIIVGVVIAAKAIRRGRIRRQQLQEQESQKQGQTSAFFNSELLFF